MRGWKLVLMTTLACAAGVVNAGCGGSQFGVDARVPVAERHVISAGSPAGQGLSLPGDRGFNIHVKQSSQNLGATGEAQGRSDATAQGQAFAEAMAAKGGSAKAEFKLGHRIDNRASVGQTMAAQIEFSLEQALAASDPPAPATIAKTELVLVVIDSRKRVVSKTMVVQAGSDSSRGSASLPQRRDVVARLEPGESYDIVLFGQVEASASDAQESSARLQVGQLEMTLTFSPVADQSGETQPAAAGVR